MKFPIVLGILAVMLVAGCLSVPNVQIPNTQPNAQPTAVCRNVTNEVPVAVQTCGNVSDTQHICNDRKLAYNSTLLPNVNICVSDGSCTGSPLENCTTCARVMSRCDMVITNKEPVQEGVWAVGANFTLGNSTFTKNPEDQMIQPNSSATFDFYQIYTTGNPLTSATCVLTVLQEPTFNDCHDETTLKLVCNSTNTTQSETTQVCD